MTVPSNENPVNQDPPSDGPDEQQQQQQQQQPGQGNDNVNPAWKEILEDLPEEFHGVLTPRLQNWDSTVQDKFQEIRSQYDPYKPLVENKIPMDRIQQAMYVAQLVEQQPEQLVEQLIEHYNLEKFRQGQSAPSNNNKNAGSNINDDDDLEDFEDDDLAQIQNHPAFKELLEKTNRLNEWYESQQQNEQANEAQERLDAYLDDLEKEKGEFDRLYVTTLMANGFDANEAIEQYQSSIQSAAAKLAQSQNPPSNPPVVMGNSGTSGSGLPDQPVDFGNMSNEDIKDFVTKYIEQSSQG